MGYPIDENILAELEKYSSPVLAKEKSLHPKILLFGRYKVGKTVLACRMGPKPLLCAADPGWSVLWDWMPGPDGIDLSNVVIDEIQGFKHLDLIANALLQGVHPHQDCDPIIVDPVTKMSDEYLSWLLKFRPSQADSRVYWHGIDPKERLDSFVTSGMGDYNALRAIARSPILTLSKLPKTVIFVCHLREPGITDKPGQSEIRTSLPGKTHELVAREVDTMAYMESNDGKRTLNFAPTNKRDVGSRIRMLHGKTINADEFPQIIEKWKAGELR